MAAGFAGISIQGVVNGCIGCVDGWLCPIYAPPANSVGRVSSFFSGHYHRFGLNVQACCDFNACITAFACDAGGGCNDAVAFRDWRLSDVASTTGDYTYLIGDNAYPQRRWLLTPFNMLELSYRPDRSNYNYVISNVRQVIERAFGIIVKKWGIVGRPMRHDIRNVPRIVHACIRLHNYCINERIAAGTFDVTMYANEVQAMTDPTAPAAELSPTAYDYADHNSACNTIMRDAMVAKVTAYNIVRPD
eukprot:GHVU01011096.1.p1 GENE.GHVU01011096.1~~GHVU01011096.1.p1  ORF type:complete len:269 (-),score=16.49 GHVU01011096.1:180-920(-)